MQWLTEGWGSAQSLYLVPKKLQHQITPHSPSLLISISLSSEQLTTLSCTEPQQQRQSWAGDTLRSSKEKENLERSPCTPLYLCVQVISAVCMQEREEGTELINFPLSSVLCSCWDDLCSEIWLRKNIGTLLLMMSLHKCCHCGDEQGARSHLSCTRCIRWICANLILFLEEIVHSLAKCGQFTAVISFPTNSWKEDYCQNLFLAICTVENCYSIH